MKKYRNKNKKIAKIKQRQNTGIKIRKCQEISKDKIPEENVNKNQRQNTGIS